MNEKNGLFYAANRIDAEFRLMNSILSISINRNLVGQVYQLVLAITTCYNASKIAVLSF